MLDPCPMDDVHGASVPMGWSPNIGVEGKFCHPGCVVPSFP